VFCVRIELQAARGAAAASADDAAWWGLDELPEDLHFGLEALLADPASARAIAARRGGQ
jgi:hypothetical protein